MIHARFSTLGTKAGCRDQLVALLTRRGGQLDDLGCLSYEVGINDERPDAVFVAELWESEDAHSASLALSSVREAIAEAMPLLSGEMHASAFDVVGSPLRD